MARIEFGPTTVVTLWHSKDVDEDILTGICNKTGAYVTAVSPQETGLFVWLRVPNLNSKKFRSMVAAEGVFSFEDDLTRFLEGRC